MKSSPFRGSARFAGAALLALLIAGCNQQQKAQRETMARGGRHAFRTACTDDIQKFCANEQKKKRCLKDNMDKLSDSCKAALAERGGGKKRDQNAAGDNDKD
ncbi:MAG TPA: hypothetical protein VHX61_20160 [Rhizomicrobium sp.]|jgi:hypothetical protein|nr:hypothetical protein [Rhizomicrobium sp.]